MNGNDKYVKLTAELARTLREKALEKGYSLRDIAVKTGYSHMTIKRIIEAKTAIEVEKFATIANYLGLVPWMVMREAEERLEESPAPTLSAVPELAEETPFQRNQRLYANVDTSIPEDLSRLAALDPNLE